MFKLSLAILLTEEMVADGARNLGMAHSSSGILLGDENHRSEGGGQGRRGLGQRDGPETNDVDDLGGEEAWIGNCRSESNSVCGVP